MIPKIRRLIKRTTALIRGRKNRQNDRVILVREDGAMTHVPREIAESRINAGWAPLGTPEAKKRMREGIDYSKYK